MIAERRTFDDSRLSADPLKSGYRFRRRLHRASPAPTQPMAESASDEGSGQMNLLNDGAYACALPTWPLLERPTLVRSARLESVVSQISADRSFVVELSWVPEFNGLKLKETPESVPSR